MKGFEFVFTIPERLGTSRSLRALLVSKYHDHPPNERFKVAKQLANSVMSMRTPQFVQKNSSPETILPCEKEQTVLGMPFLVGFKIFRPADGKTDHFGDSLWQQNLYGEVINGTGGPLLMYCTYCYPT